MLERIAFYATQRHYVDHLTPIAHALAGRADLSFHGPARLERHATGYVLDDIWQRGLPPNALTVVAGWADARKVLPRPVVLLNHGVGQTYTGDGGDAATSPHYTAGARKGIHLYLSPSQQDADRSGHRAVAVGCPKLDPWHRQFYVTGRLPTVALSWHWNCRLVPETMNAWPHFAPAMLPLIEWAAAEDVDLLGHAHPRIWPNMRGQYAAAAKGVPRGAGFELVADFAEVLGRADLLVCDNSSAMYEFASVGKPVLALNAPWYRRDVNHGMRFWDYVPGLQCDNPENLIHAVVAALSDPPEAKNLRRRAVDRAYVACDGHAAERAAQAILELAAEGVELVPLRRDSKAAR